MSVSKSLSRVATLGILILAAAAFAQPVKTLRWAAIGDAVSNAGWPARTGLRLPMDSVINYGHGGGTALRSGDSSYWASGRLAQIFAYAPDIVSIQLGSSDSKSVNWADSANFEKDYKALIDTLASMPSQPRIIVVYPTPVWKNETAPQSPGLRRGTVIENSIVPLLRKIARDKGADTVDLHTPMLARQTLFTDSLLPTTAGNDTLGRRVFLGLVEQSIRIACVGNSITYAVNTNGTIPVKEAYAMRLNMLLGKRYWVWNGGKTGWWMQRATLPGSSSAYKSYVTDKTQMDSLFLLKPHFITVKLGTNDARQNFWNTARYVTDYRYFIDTLYDNMTPKPKFLLLKAIPAWRIGGNWPFSNGGANTPELNGINGDIIRDSVGPAIDAIAASRPTAVAQVVDLYTAFLTYGPTGPAQNLVTDGVHPTRVGQDTLARILYRSIQPTVTAIRPPHDGKAAGRAHPSRAARYVRTASGKAAAQDAGLKSVDGKSTGQGLLAPGVYVKPAAASASKKETK